jgi:hypothetical protein
MQKCIQKGQSLGSLPFLILILIHAYDCRCPTTTGKQQQKLDPGKAGKHHYFSPETREEQHPKKSNQINQRTITLILSAAYLIRIDQFANE